jgi:phospholipid/cholesterol/gamma-HCH transport system substrate-binding protein
MSRRARWLRRLPALALAALVLAGVGALVFGGGTSYVVRAEFADAEGLKPDFAVRVQGVTVGRVASVAVTRRDTAMVKLQLDPVAVPIGAGARASIHPSNLLGEKYVQLDPGDLRHPQRSGTTIPLARTAVTSELDQVLDTFDPNTRRATAIFLAETGDALLGRGQSLASLLGRLPQSLSATEQLLAGLGHDNAALGRLIEEADRILRAAAPQRAALGRLVGSADGAFATLASRAGPLAATIADAPGALAQLRRTLVALQGAAGELGPAAAGLRSAAGPLAGALRAVPAFASAARPALAAVKRAAPALTELGAVGAPVLAALRPAGVAVRRVAAALAPVSRTLAGNIGQMLDVAQGWARAISDRDGVGHVYRIEVLFPQGDLTSLLHPAALARSSSSSARHASGAGSGPGASSAPSAGALGNPRPPARPRASAAPPSPSHPSPPATPPAAAAPPAAPPPGLGSLLRYLLGR